MKHKIVIITFSILLLLVFTTDSFAKIIEKDQTIQKIDSNSKKNRTKSEIQTKFPPMTSSSTTDKQINWQVISSGGIQGTSTNFILSGTIGQTAIGSGSSTNYIVNAGFWQTFNSESCCLGAIRGDYDLSGEIDISDLVALVNFMFSGGTPSDCFEEADVDSSGGIDISDLIGLVDFIFSGGAEPMPCP